MCSKDIAGHALCKYSKQRALYHRIIMKPNTLDLHIIMFFFSKKINYDLVRNTIIDD